MSHKLFHILLYSSFLALTACAQSAPQTASSNQKPLPPTASVGSKMLWTAFTDTLQGTVRVYNARPDRSTADLVLHWTLLENGEAIASGMDSELNVAAADSADVALENYKLPATHGEISLIVAYRLKADTLGMQAGDAIATQAFTLGCYPYPDFASYVKAQPKILLGAAKNKKKSRGSVTLQETTDSIILSAGKVRAAFDKKTGFLERLEQGEQPLLGQGNALRPCVEGLASDGAASCCGTTGELKLTNLSTNTYSLSRQVIATYSLPDTPAKLVVTYTLNAQGKLWISEKVERDEAAPRMLPLPSPSVALTLPTAHDKLTYYGRSSRSLCTDDIPAPLLARHEASTEAEGRMNDLADVRWLATFSDSLSAGTTLCGTRPLNIKSLPEPTCHKVQSESKKASNTNSAPALSLYLSAASCHKAATQCKKANACTPQFTLLIAPY